MARHVIDRRRFMATLVLIPVGARLAGCGGDDEGGGSEADAGLCGVDASSSVVANHTHTLCILREDLDDPPKGGKEYVTDVGMNVPHTHTVTLTQEQLQAIADAGEVTVTTSSDQGHMHQFTLAFLT